MYVTYVLKDHMYKLFGERGLYVFAISVQKEDYVYVISLLRGSYIFLISREYLLKVFVTA